MFCYPDIVVICGAPEYLDNHRDVVTDPTAIIEVLSDSTEAFDRCGKFRRYQAYNPTLADYMLVSQNEPAIELFSRLSGGTWSYRVEMELGSVIGIPSIGCTLKLADVYDRVAFA